MDGHDEFLVPPQAADNEPRPTGGCIAAAVFVTLVAAAGGVVAFLWIVMQ